MTENRAGCYVETSDRLFVQVRTWSVYSGAESTVRNMMTSLKAVTELQNSAIRERHWQQLMNATGVR